MTSQSSDQEFNPQLLHKVQDAIHRATHFFKDQNYVPTKMEKLVDHAISWTKVVKILEKPKKLRNPQEHLHVNSHLNKIKLFQKIQNENPNHADEIIEKCIDCFEIVRVPENHIVFERGTQGHHYYLILSGVIGVWVLNPKATQEQIEAANEKLQQKYPHCFSQLQGLVQVNSMTFGEGFGELALLNDQPRMASILTEMDCIFARLNKVNFKKILEEVKRQQLRRDLDELNQVQGFQKLSRRALQMLLFCMTKVSYKYKDVMYYEGDVPKKIYITRTGEFQVLKQQFNLSSAKHQLQKQQIESCVQTPVAIISSRQIFGDYEVFKKMNRVFTVQCFSCQADVFEIKAEDFVNQLKMNDIDALEFFQNISQGKNRFHDIYLQNCSQLMSIIQSESQDTQFQLQESMVINNHLSNKKKKQPRVVCYSYQNAQNDQVVSLNKYCELVEKKQVPEVDNNHYLFPRLKVVKVYRLSVPHGIIQSSSSSQRQKSSEELDEVMQYKLLHRVMAHRSRRLKSLYLKKL